VPVYQSATTIATGLSLNSWEFLLIAALAIMLCAVIDHFRARYVALLALNIYVLTTFMTGVMSFVVLALFLLTVYVVGMGRKRRNTQFPLGVQLLVIGLFWVFLFLVRDGDLLALVNPFHYIPVYIIGISYMVFRCISFIMEVEFIENPSFARFCAYVLFFPGLLAGPIERYRNFEAQLATPVYDSAHVMPALHRIANGLIKKFVIADNLAVYGVFSFHDAADVSTPMLWVGTLGQLWLIYMDFSGYCDIVIGVAALMGFRMIENFNHPFRSVTIQEFWNRWHISLSTLVKDYIFTPINILIIKNIARKRQFLLITGVYFFSMILIGLWHGMTWGFVAFGTVHGAALVGIQLIKKKQKPVAAMAWYEIRARQFLVYAFVSTTLIFWMKSADEWAPIYAKLLGLQ